MLGRQQIDAPPGRVGAPDSHLYRISQPDRGGVPQSVIAVFAAIETWRRLRARHSGGEAETAYYRASARGRALVGLTYLALVVLLVLGMHATHLYRTL